MPGGYRIIRYPPVVLNQQEVDSVTAVNRKKVRPKSFERKLERTAYLFIMPAAILLIIFCIVPMLGSFFVSTQKMGVDLSKAEFVGLDNYTKALSDRRFLQSVGISLKYTAVEVPLQMIIGLVLSALLAKNTVLNKLFRSIYFLPVVASAVTVGVTWQLVLHSNIGIFTYWLKLLGMKDANLLNNTSTALYVVVFVAIWKTFGISAIILVSAIQNISDSLFEAAASRKDSPVLLGDASKHYAVVLVPPDDTHYRIASDVRYCLYHDRWRTQPVDDHHGGIYL